MIAKPVRNVQKREFTMTTMIHFFVRSAMFGLNQLAVIQIVNFVEQDQKVH